MSAESDLLLNPLLSILILLHFPRALSPCAFHLLRNPAAPLFLLLLPRETRNGEGTVGHGTDNP